MPRRPYGGQLRLLIPYLRLFQFIDVNDFGILSLVGVVGTVVHVHVFDKATAKTVLGKHTFHNAHEQGVDAGFDVFVVALFDEHFGSQLALTAGIAGVVQINLVSKFFTGKNHFVCVDDDYIVTAVHEGAIAGFVFSAQNFGNFCAEATKNLVGSVDNHPFFFLCLGGDS